MIGRIPFIHWRFYIEHARRDLTYNMRRTAFALFCVAAGVAAIVALRTLALSIGDTLVNNIAGNMHGDMVLDEPRFAGGQFTIQSSALNDTLFSIYAVQQIKAWAGKNHVQYTDALMSTGGLTIAPQNGSNVGRPQFTTSYLVDPAVYPLYSPITAIEPPGVPFAQLFTGGNDVVISKALADNDGIKVGDQVHVSRTTQLFTVR